MEYERRWEREDENVIKSEDVKVNKNGIWWKKTDEEKMMGNIDYNNKKWSSV